MNEKKHIRFLQTPRRTGVSKGQRPQGLLSGHLTFRRLQPDGLAVRPRPCSVIGPDPRPVHRVEVETVDRADRLLAAVYLLEGHDWVTKLLSMLYGSDRLSYIATGSRCPVT